MFGLGRSIDKTPAGKGVRIITRFQLGNLCAIRAGVSSAFGRRADVAHYGEVTDCLGTADGFRQLWTGP